MKVWERTNQEPTEHQIRGTKESNATYHFADGHIEHSGRRKNGRPRNSRRRKVEAEIRKAGLNGKNSKRTSKTVSSGKESLMAYATSWRETA